MTLKELYAEVNGSYDEAMGRFLKEERLLKYLRRLESSIDFKEYFDAVAEDRWEDAFRFTHNVKGVALNLELGDLAIKGSELCELLRHGKPDTDVSGLAENLEKIYKKTVSLIASLDE